MATNVSKLEALVLAQAEQIAALTNAMTALVAAQNSPKTKMGYNTPKVEKPVKVLPTVTAELRKQVVEQIERDIVICAAKGERPYGNRAYYFNGIAARNIGYAAMKYNGGKVDPSLAKDETIIAVARDYGFLPKA